MARLTRLSTEGVDGVNAGIGSIFKALAAAPMVRQQAQDDSALRAAQTYAQNMAGNKYGAEAEGVGLTNKYRTELVDGTLAGIADIPAFQQFALKTYGITGKGDPHNIAQAAGDYQKQASIADIQGGADPLKTSQAYFAVSGKAPFDAVGNTGRSMNQLTGFGRIIDEALASGWDGKVKSETAENNAQAFQANATGKNQLSHIPVNQAHAEKLKAETEQVRNKPQAGAPAVVGYDAQGNPITDTKGAPKPPAEYLKQADAYQNMDDAITLYDKTLAGFSGVDWVNPQRRAELSNAYQNMLLQSKEIYRLGVLNGPDKQILESIIKNPLDLKTMHLQKDTLFKQSEQMREIIRRGNTNLAKVYRQPQIPLNSEQATPPAGTGGKTIVRTGTLNGRKVVQYSDGSTAYAD